MKFSSRFFLYAPIAVLALLAVIVSVWWRMASTAFDEKLAASNGREIMPGVRMSYVSKSTGGFPFRVDSELEGLTLAVQTRTGPLIWQTEHFAIHALTYASNQQIFEAAGKQTLSWTDSDGLFHRFVFVPGSLRASAVLADNALVRFDLDAVGVTTSEFLADRLQLHLRRRPAADALDFFVSGDNLRVYLHDRFGPPQQISAQGGLEPAAPLGALLQGATDWRNASESWRQHGGRLTIDRIEAQLSQLKAAGSGKLSLDDQHRLEGRIVLSYAPSRFGRSGLTYVFDNGRVYFNSVQPNNIVMSPSADMTLRNSDMQLDATIESFLAMRERNAVVLNPLY